MRSLGVYAVSLVVACLIAGPLRAHPADGQPAADVAGRVDYAPVATGADEIVFGPVSIKVLVDAAVLGSGEVEVGELTMPAGYRGGAHGHGAIEIFYVVEGVMNHVVNGVAHRLEPGMVGLVRPGDSVTHEVLGSAPVRAVVVWAPGGEADRLRRAAATPPAESTQRTSTE